MTHPLRTSIRAWRSRIVLATVLALAASPAWARSKGCTVHCELQSAVLGLLIALFLLYGLLVLNTGTRIGVKQTVLYVVASLATGALSWTAATLWLGLSPWLAAGVMVVLVLAVFVFLFNPRRHRDRRTG